MKPFATVLFTSAIGIIVSLQAQTLAPTVTGAVVGPTFYAAAYGIIADGMTDQCLGTKLSNLIAAVNPPNKGGTIVFDAGTTVFSSCNFSLASGLALGPNVFLVGRGAASSNHLPSTPPTVLKFSSTTGVAHIECLTEGGQCGAANLTVQDSSTDKPFFLFTYGIPYLDNVTCWGRYNRQDNDNLHPPVNDCVWLGNPGSTMCSGSGTTTDSKFCDYGNTSHINIMAVNTRRALVFGDSANGVTAEVYGNYTDANVGLGPMFSPMGGFIEFVGHSPNGSTYGNTVYTVMEMAPNGVNDHCNYSGAVEFVSYGSSNIITAVAGDDGNCAYIVRVDDDLGVSSSSSGKNKITVQVGIGGSGCVYDSSGNYSNEIECLNDRTYGVRDLNTPHIGRTTPLNDMRMSIGYTIGMSNPLPSGPYGTMAWVTDSSDGTCANGGGVGDMIDVLCFYDGMNWVPMGNLSSPRLTSPNIGAATGTSLLAKGTVDGTMPVTVTTGTSASLGVTYQSGYTFNQATGAVIVTYGLPGGTVAAGQSYCIANSNNGSSKATSQLKLQAASGQQIIFTDGTLTTMGYLQSAGAGGDEICVVFVNSGHWQVKGTPRGSWSHP